MFRHSVTTAIVLQSRAIGEIHKSVTMLTPGMGLVYAIAHGAKKMGSRLRSTTEIFCMSRVYLYTDPVRGSHKITDMEGLRLFDGIRSRLYRFYAASLWAETVLRSFGGGEHSPFGLLRECLGLCESAGEAETDHLTIQFIWRYLRLMGYGPDLDACSACGAAAAEDEVLFLGGDSLALVCGRCVGGDVVEFTAGARRYLIRTAAEPLVAVLRFRLAAAALTDLKALLVDAVQQVLEVRLNTVDSVRGMR